MKRTAATIGLGLILLSLTGCDFFSTPGERATRRAIADMKDIAATLHDVKDADSAKAALDELDKSCEALKADRDTEAQYSGEKRPKQIAKELSEGIEESKKQLDAELTRLRDLRGLPVEFWKIIDMKVVHTADNLDDRALTEIDKLPEIVSSNTPASLSSMWKKYGYEKVVQLQFVNLPNNLIDKALEHMRKSAPEARLFSVVIDRRDRSALGPIKDYKAFVAGIDFGEVTFEDEGQRIIHITVDRRKLGARANSDEEEARLRAKEAEESSKKLREQMEADSRQRQLEMAREMQAHEKRNRGPDPDDPNYFEILAESIATGDHFEKDKAIDALLAADPTQVSSAETRKKIARSFKNLVETGGHFEKAKAIKGLVIWGGKYSMPILLKMLDEAHEFDQEELIKAIGELKDPAASEALVQRLGNRYTQKFAYAALKQIGSGAEDALIDGAPSEDPQLSLASVTLLGEVGTEKCVATLREAQTSRNAEIRDAAKASMRKVLARKNKAKSKATNDSDE